VRIVKRNFWKEETESYTEWSFATSREESYSAMDFSQTNYLCNRQTVFQNASDSSLGDTQEHCPHPTPTFPMCSNPADASPQATDILPFNVMNTNLFLQQPPVRADYIKEDLQGQVANYCPATFRSFDGVPTSHGLEMSLVGLQ